MPPISPLRVRLTRVSMAMRNSNTSSEEDTPVVEEGNSSRTSGAWKNRFSALSALVQQQDLPFGSKELEEEEDSQEIKPAERRDSLHILFNSSFSNLCDDITDEDDSDSEDELEAEKREEAQEEQVEDHAMHTLEKVQETLKEIFQYLQKWGIPQDLLQELYKMEKRLQYTALLKQAEEYATEYLLSASSQDEEDQQILDKFVSAWNYVHEYSQDRYQQIQKVYSELQWKQWQNQVTKFSEEKDQEGHPEEDQQMGGLGGLGLGLVRQLTRERDTAVEAVAGGLAAGLKRSLTKEAPATQTVAEEKKQPCIMAIKEQLASAVRFRMECQKQCILTKEWTVSIQRQRRQQLAQQKPQPQTPVTPPPTVKKQQTPPTLSSPKPQKQQGLLRKMMPRMASFKKSTTSAALNTSSHHHRHTVGVVACRQ